MQQWPSDREETSMEIYVNLPVKDLERARRFYNGLGFETNPDFSDDTASNAMISEHIVVMLLTEERFRDFITGQIADATTSTEVLNALSADSREAVDELADKALAVGGQPWRDPMDEGPMYGRSFQDPDGHVWEVFHMDMGQAAA
jgi:predicted lactoylglutathione lyase